MIFAGKDSSGNRDVTRGGYIREEAWYPITPAQLRKIGNASEVRLKIYGRQSLKRTLSASQLSKLKQWVRQYVEAVPEAPEE